jgi:FlaA1/EpsC-like NDP-sugar epimerase
MLKKIDHLGIAVRSLDEAVPYYEKALGLKCEHREEVPSQKVRTAFFSVILLSDIAIIVTMSWLTGVSYHLAVYGFSGDIISYLEVGLLSAMVFVIPNLFRAEYNLRNFFAFKPHLRRAFQFWNLTFICLLAVGFMSKISVIYSRGWIVLFYASTICVLLALRYAFVQATVRGSRLISAQRVFLVGTGRHIGEFIARSEPATDVEHARWLGGELSNSGKPTAPISVASAARALLSVSRGRGVPVL